MSATKTTWKRSAIAVAIPVVAALIVGLGSTACGLYRQVQSLEAQLLVSNKVNEQQQKEIDRLWDNLTFFWKTANARVRTEGPDRP